jgi:hypothetical protein
MEALTLVDRLPTARDAQALHVCKRLSPSHYLSTSYSCCLSTKDADEQANRQRITDNKAKAIANKAQKEALKDERTLQAIARQ